MAEWLAPQLAQDGDLLVQVVGLLDAPAWPVRCGAARALVAMPGGPPPELMPKLVGLLTDARGEESWIDRVGVAQIFINDRDKELSRQAIDVCLQALDYATQPWYHLPRSGAAVRKQAAVVLGQLEPIYRERAIFDRLALLVQEDKDPEVRDAAFAALLRLAAAPEAVGGADSGNRPDDFRLAI